MKKIISKLLYAIPSLYLFVQLFRPRIGSVKGDLQSVHDLFVNKDLDKSIAVDLGCGPSPQNRFNAENSFGIDLYENPSKNVSKIQLGFQKLPFESDSVDYLTAYDLLEHIPRYAALPEHGNNPFIFLMNECYRVLRKGGVFLSMTPIYPYLDAFQDPTHNNIMTVDTFRTYFSNKHAKLYGITANFEICYQKMLGPHLVAVMKK